MQVVAVLICTYDYFFTFKTMIKLIVLFVVLFEPPGRNSINVDTCGIPAYLREYFLVSRDSVKEPDVDDVFFVVTPGTREEGFYREESFDSTQFHTPSINYHIERFGYNLVFTHFNINVEKVACYFGEKRETTPLLKQVVRALPKAFLSKVKLIDLNKRLMEIKSKEEVRDFLKEFEKKRVWIVDRTFMTEETVILVETGLGIIII